MHALADYVLCLNAFWKGCAGPYRRTGPVSFRGGGGGWGQLPEYFLYFLPENQVVLPEYYASLKKFEKF